MQGDDDDDVEGCDFLDDDLEDLIGVDDDADEEEDRELAAPISAAVALRNKVLHGEIQEVVLLMKSGRKVALQAAEVIVKFKDGRQLRVTK